MNIEEYLQKFTGKVLWYKANPGNGGDALIALGAYQLFEKYSIEFKIITKDTDLNNKYVLYAGGGNLVNNYSDAANFIKQYHKIVKKLVFLPHTIEGHEDILATLGSNVEIICRENISYQYVKQFNNIGKTYLLDDLAFSLDVNCLMKFAYPKKLMLKALYKTYFNKLLKNRSFDFKTLNAFRIDVERTSIKIPKDNIDVSTAFLFDPSMKNYDLVKRNVAIIFHFLNQFETINTNRLHIGITGTLLGKVVNFYPNSYWKNQAVYLQSMKGKYPHIKWKGEKHEESLS